MRLLCPWRFSRQENWSGLPGPIPGGLPNPGIEPRSPTLQADSLPSETPRRISHQRLHIAKSPHNIWTNIGWQRANPLIFGAVCYRNHWCWLIHHSWATQEQTERAYTRKAMAIHSLTLNYKIPDSPTGRAVSVTHHCVWGCVSHPHTQPESPVRDGVDSPTLSRTPSSFPTSSGDSLWSLKENAIWL